MCEHNPICRECQLLGRSRQTCVLLQVAILLLLCTGVQWPSGTCMSVWLESNGTGFKSQLDLIIHKVKALYIITSRFLVSVCVIHEHHHDVVQVTIPTTTQRLWILYWISVEKYNKKMVNLGPSDRPTVYSIPSYL